MLERFTLGKTNIEPVAVISPILHGTSVGKFTGESKYFFIWGSVIVPREGT